MPESFNVPNNSVLRFSNGVKIHVDAEGTITLEGKSDINFKTDGTINFDAAYINVRSKYRTIVESDLHLVNKAARIDLNPLTDDWLELFLEEENENLTDMVKSCGCDHSSHKKT